MDQWKIHNQDANHTDMIYWFIYEIQMVIHMDIANEYGCILGGVDIDWVGLLSQVVASVTEMITFNQDVASVSKHKLFRFKQNDKEYRNAFKNINFEDKIFNLAIAALTIGESVQILQFTQNKID